MRGACSEGGFGDASGFGDVADVTQSRTRVPGEGQRPRLNGFGDSDGFGDAGSFDLGGFGRRRSDRNR